MSSLRLLALPTSPFAARLVIQILEKQLDVTVEHPRNDETPQQFGADNPFGKTPILLVGETRIIESASIAEYLEDRYPDPSLRGNDDLSTAQTRAFVRAVDLYLFPALFRLRATAPGSHELNEVLSELNDVLDRLEKLFGHQEYISGTHLTLADCALIPACFYLRFFCARQDQPDPIDTRERLRCWWQRVNKHDSVVQVIDRLSQALPTKS